MKSFKMSLFKPGIFLLIFVAGSVFVSCNKALPVEEPAEIPELNPGSTQTIGEKISTDPDYSIYFELIKNIGMLPGLSDPNKVWTVFAPDNDAFLLSGVSSPDIFGPKDTAVGMYTIVPGQQFLTSAFTNELNSLLPSNFRLGNIPPLTLQMAVFPSVQNGFWINNIPIGVSDQKFKNGVIHSPKALALPPSDFLGILVNEDPDLGYFRAAMEYANTNKEGDANLNNLLNNPAISTTLFAPDDNAVKQLLVGFISQYLIDSMGIPGNIALLQAQTLVVNKGEDIFKDEMIGKAMKPDDVYGLLAYHILTKKLDDTTYLPFQRIFGNNLTGPIFQPTLINSSKENPLARLHPGVQIIPTVTGSMVTGIKVGGMGTFPTGGAPFSGSPVSVIPKSGSSLGLNGINGIYYVIDGVLLPQ